MRMMIQLHLALLAFLFLAIPNAHAIILEFNGNYYEKVEDSISWTEARAAAEARSYMGTTGHLATITSMEETTFLISNFETYGSWIGGFQFDKLAEPVEHWRWVTDEPWIYTNWFAPNEPNESGGLEDFLVFVGIDRSDGSVVGQWNDWKNFGDIGNRPAGYFVEYEGNIIPEISTVNMIIFAFTAIFLFQRDSMRLFDE